MGKLIHNIGNLTINFTKNIGEVILHFYIALINIKPFRYRELLLHIEFVGSRSLLIIFITGLFTGFVFAYQTWLGLNLFDIENIIGTVSALSIFREIGPVMTGIILSARAGGAMAARLGTMVVTDQIDAIEVMGISSKNYLVTPRILASIIATPLLAVVFSLSAMFGCYILAVKINNLEEYNQFIPQFIKDRLFNGAARFIQSEKMLTQLGELLDLIGYETIPIEMGKTQADARIHDIQTSRQIGSEPGTVIEVILPGLRRIADGEIIQKPVVIRGE